MKKIASLYKDSYSGLSNATWGLSAVMLINRCGTMVVPFMTLYMTQALGYKLWQATIVISIFGLGAICGGFIGGWLSGKFGFYNVQLATLIGGGSLFFVLGQMTSFQGICIMAFILSLVNEAFRPANSIAIAHYSKTENRTRSYSLNRLAINLGWALGGFIGGMVASHDYHLLFWIDGCTNIFAALLLRIFLKPATSHRSSQSNIEKAKPGAAFRDKNYVAFSVFTVMYATCFFQLFNTLPVYYRTQLNLSEATIGLLMALNGVLVALFEMVLVFRLEGKRPVLQFIVPGTLLMALSFAIFNMLPGGLALAVVSVLLVTVGEMLSMPFMNTYWISRSNDSNRGQYAGLYTVSWAIAQVLGPAAGGRLADVHGYDTLWWAVGITGAISCGGYFLLHRYEARKTLVAK